MSRTTSRSIAVGLALAGCGGEHDFAAPTSSTPNPPESSGTPSASSIASVEDARAAALREAQEFGLPGRLGGPPSGSPWGSAGALDPSIWGDEFGSPGPGGAASSEVPRGKGPFIRKGEHSVSGRLPQEVVLRIIRQNFGRLRLCYETALRTSPKLAGKVTLMFTIRRDGTVESASAQTDLTDPAVSSCMARGLGTLSFPAPDGGVVKVSYELLLAPGDAVEDVKHADGAR